MISVAIVERALDAAVLQAAVAAPNAGAIALFVGVVRDENGGRVVNGIEYTAYSGMATRELEAVAREAVERFGGVRIAVEHRIGSLAVGDASVVVAVAHAHRLSALEACRFVIEQLKQRVPIWKREHYVDGTREWVHASSAAVGSPAPAAATP